MTKEISLEDQRKQHEFDILFSKMYTIWVGDMDSLVKWCRKRVGIKD